jgi:signal transduction histidine kinase
MACCGCSAPWSNCPRRLDGGDEVDPNLCADADAAPGGGRGGGLWRTLKITWGQAAWCVRVPEVLLVSAMRNLLDNAVRASPEDAGVDLRIVSGSDGQVRFEVLDRGPGLSEEDRAMATRRFWRRSKAAGGSGLGLAIVDAIAKRHGGSFSLAPRVEGGLQARLELPAAAPGAFKGAAKPRSAAARHIGSVRAGRRHKRILLRCAAFHR